MNRYIFMYRVRKITGRLNLTRMQQFLKYILNFRKDYYHDCHTSADVKNPTVVFCIDGKTIHGGLSDRLRGLFSIYSYCLSREKQLVINWIYPFRLSDYLEINKEVRNVKWGGYLSHNKKEVAFRFFNSYSSMDDQERSYFKLLDTDKAITHVYSNVTLHEELYSKYFNELFTPSIHLQNSIEKCLSEIGGNYVSITFRFIGLLGDFKYPFTAVPRLTEEQKKDYIDHGLKAIKQVHELHRNTIKKILVTADSNLFLSKAVEVFPFAYAIPGKVVHMDAESGKSYKLHEREFLDFFMISKAQESYTYQYGKMFGATRFARTAALVDGRKIKEITDNGLLTGAFAQN